MILINCIKIRKVQTIGKHELDYNQLLSSYMDNSQTICFPYSLIKDPRNDSATSIFLCLEINRNSKDSIMTWFYCNPQPCIYIANLNYCLVYDKCNYSTLLFIWKNITWIKFLLYPIPYGNIITSVYKWL